MATPQVKDLVLRSPAGSCEVVTFTWPLQVGTGQDKHDNGIDIIDTIKFVCDELPSISSAFEEINLNQIDTACYKTMTNLVDRFNKAVDSIVALEKGTSLPAERLNKFAHPSLLRHILQLVYNAAVLDPDKLNNYEPFSPEVYGETSYELVQQMIKHVNVSNDDTFIDLGSGVGQVVLQMAGSFPLKTCIGIEKADTPAQYAERMDQYFRQFMAWFGKRYCEYKLIKGDFLVSEHREKITSSTLVFVNNFAFGPNVDHQLKERFADLRDGARIVSSKSFCPLNFRITDRNLSDIGTIMHVSEIPPLKGSVSWTCKPVSYYLHVIDRTILERYFQRMKTQKGVDHEHVGSTRTTRDRAKREAHHTLHNNNNNTTTSSFSITSTTTAIMQNTQSASYNHTNNNNNSNSSTTTTNGNQAVPATNGLKSRQQQRNVDVDTSTESDGDAVNGDGGSSTTIATVNGCGPMTRKGWSDWCSPKCDKSSQSDDEENNNSNNYDTTRTGVRGNANAPKKRKKLTRKAAIASKSAAAAAQREAALGKENTSTKEDTGVQNGRGRKGRTKKGARGRKSLKIAGLDVLHKQTLLSTSVEMLSKKLPPAPGCVDQQLTSLLTDNMSHIELDIPTAPQDTPYALQILLDVFRAQYMVMIDQLKSPQYVPQLQRQIQVEQEHKQRLKNRASQLDKQIKVLIDDSVALLKQRMNELGISVSSPNELIAKAKEIVGRHKELQTMAKRIQTQVTACELEQRQLLQQQLQNLPTYRNWYESGNNNNFNAAGANISKLKSSELSESAAHELVLREIANTLATRKKLYAQVASLQTETVALEQTVEEKSASTILLAQGTNMILNTTAHKSMATTTAISNATVIADNVNNITNLSNNVLQQPLQLTTTNILKSNISNIVPNHLPIQVTTTATAGKFTKSPRRQHNREQRDARLRAQEWPDVPDVGKIEESNPEVLAQKILETGRQIEAGKFVHVNHNNINTNKQQIEKNSYSNQNCFLPKRRLSGERNSAAQNASNAMYMTGNDNSLMPAPILRGQHQSTVITSAAASTQRANMSPGSVVSLLPICKESPKVANFEHRLKSIITTVLNEDQEQRKQKQQQQTHSSLLLPEQNSPIAKRKMSAAQQQQQQQHEPSQMSISTNQNLTPSNVSTTPSATSVSTPANYIAANKFLVNAANNKNHQMLPSSMANSSSVSSMVTSAYSSAHKYISTKDAAKYQQQHQQQQQQPAHMAHMYATNLALHRRRPTVTAASFEQFAAQQQQQLQHQQEFKAPNMSRSASREHLNDMELPPQRNSSGNSDTAVPQANVYYERLVIPPPIAKNLTTSNTITERCNNHDIESVTTPPVVYTPSRPNSTSSQPDYTQVSPAKMALRRHLSQEKLNQLQSNTTPTPTPTTTPTLIVAPLSTKTIGDLVNGEIERTLEISHQSIINAVVNKSTVGAQNSVSNNSGVVLTSIYNTERERLPLHERLLINPNVQRPERVNVRVIDEHHVNHGLARKCSTPPIKTTSSAHGNLNTLAQAAYNHKLMQANSSSDGRNYNTSNSFSSHLNNQQHQTQQQQHQSALSNNLLSVSNGRQYQTVALPRAEINGCIEAYFSEEQAQPQSQQQHQQQQQHHEQPHYHVQQQHLPLKEHKLVKEHRATIGGRNGRLNGSNNPPLEGLAASLQVHVLASRKFKEEHEERQRRAIISNHVDETSNHNHYQQHQSQEQQQQAINGNIQHQNNRSPVKVEIGIKRTSPMTSNQPRPSKMPHYSHENNLTQQQYHQIHQQQQQNQQIYPYNHCKGSAHVTATTSNNMQADQDQRQQLLPPRKKIEPISPEMNSLINDERLHYHNEQAQQQPMVVQQFHPLQPAKNSRSTPISVSGRNGEDGKNTIKPTITKFPNEHEALSTNATTTTIITTAL